MTLLLKARRNTVSRNGALAWKGRGTLLNKRQETPGAARAHGYNPEGPTPGSAPRNEKRFKSSPPGLLSLALNRNELHRGQQSTGGRGQVPEGWPPRPRPAPAPTPSCHRWGVTASSLCALKCCRAERPTGYF